MTVLGRLGRRLVTTEVVNLTRLKWLTIILPLAALVVLIVMLRSSLHPWLHEGWGVVFLTLFFAVCVFGFASVVFALIENLEDRVVEQNRQLSSLLERMEGQNAELSAFLTVSRAAATSIELPQMLDEALEAILSGTPAEAAEVWLSKGGRLTLERFRGVGATAFGSRTSLHVGEGLPGAAAKRGAAVMVHERAFDPRFGHEDIIGLDLRTFYATPLQDRLAVVGVLAVAARSETAFASPHERRVLEGIGDQIALAVENTRLHERILDRAVLEERERISRELHDGLAQTLGYINTQTLALKKLLESGRIDEGTRELETMSELSREVYGDVREAIIGLQTAPTGLVPAIRDYLGRLPHADSRRVELRLDEELELVALDPTVEIQVVRIVQEALSNVRKHADATHVEVVVEAEDESVHVEIADDGGGFDPALPDRTGWPRLGLQTMRERAQSIGGTFEVVSSVGNGTRVTVHVPTASRREEAVRAGASG